MSYNREKQQLNVTIKLNGWLKNTSALVSSDCVLFKIKELFISNLLEKGIINESNLDSQNKTAYVKITSDSFPKDESAYNRINNKQITIVFNDIRVNKDLVEINLGSGIYMQLIYKKFICDHKKQILMILGNIFNILCKENYKSNDQPKVANGKSNDDDDNNKESTSLPVCAICYEKDRNCCISCGHIAMCYECATKCTNCPICKVEIKSRTKVFIS